MTAVRTHLGMQVAYISEFRGDEAILLEVDGRWPRPVVESDAELATFRELGADYAQGYLLGRPVALDEALALFGRRRSIRSEVA